jgi:3-hydroxybutyrate dehydrogenase/3-oxoacyl-[acyl-carrier protein] reductase
MNSRSPVHGKEALENLGAPHRSLFVAGDVRQKADAEGFIDATIRRFGHIDVLVNNAGGVVATELVDRTTDATWHDTIAWNLSSAFWATRRALPSMLERQWGRIINISGVLGKKGSGAGVAPYVRCKHALIGFTKAVAAEYGRSGITCNAICPGHIETDAMRAYATQVAPDTGVSYQDALRPFAEESLVGRLTTVEEIGSVAALLCSPVGDGITGATWSVDGGNAPW